MKGKKLCPFCGIGTLSFETRQEVYTYRGHTLEVEQPGEYCLQCGEGILSAKDMQSTQAEIETFQQQVDEAIEGCYGTRTV